MARSCNQPKFKIIRYRLFMKHLNSSATRWRMLTQVSALCFASSQLAPRTRSRSCWSRNARTFTANTMPRTCARRVIGASAATSTLTTVSILIVPCTPRACARRATWATTTPEKSSRWPSSRVALARTPPPWWPSPSIRPPYPMIWSKKANSLISVLTTMTSSLSHSESITQELIPFPAVMHTIKVLICTFS